VARTKREYENEIPTGLDLDGDDKDYSVMLAEADTVRANAAVAIQKYRVMREAEERVARINAILRRSLGVSDG
jgi:hypothetical protein